MKRRIIEPTIMKRRKANCSVKSHQILVRDDDGSLRETLLTDTLWYILYVVQATSNDRLHKLFRSRFSMPYEMFITLSHEVTAHSCFS